MRKAISTVVALSLIGFGVWWLWGLVEHLPPTVRGLHILIGLVPAIAGAVWLASDWWYDR